MRGNINGHRRNLSKPATVTAIACLAMAVTGLPSIAAADATRTRIAVCETGAADRARGLGESLLGSVIQNTLGRIGAALRAAGEASTKSTVVHANIQVKSGEPVTCLQIARGRWSDNENTAWKDKLNAKMFYGGVADGWLQPGPDFVLHLRLKESDDKSAMKLVPMSLEYGRHLADTKRGSRGISMELSFHGPGQPADHKDAVGASIVLGDFEPGFRYDLVGGSTEEWDKRDNQWELDGDEIHPALQEESHWFPTHAPLPVASRSAGGGNTSGGGASAGRGGGGGARSNLPGAPKIITVTIAETRAARPMLLFLADVFDASKEDIQSSLEAKLLKSKRDESELAAAKETNNQLVAMVTAVADAEVALAKYCEMGTGKKKSEYLTQSKAIFVAMNSANFIAGNLGKPAPFAEVPAPSDQALCR